MFLFVSVLLELSDMGVQHHQSQLIIDSGIVSLSYFRHINSQKHLCLEIYICILELAKKIMQYSMVRKYLLPVSISKYLSS